MSEFDDPRTFDPDSEAEERRNRARGLTELETFEDQLERNVPDLYVTPALIACNVIVFLVTGHAVGFGDPSPEALIRWGAVYGPLVLHQPWRLVSGMFLHAGIAHLFFNMWALYASGHIVERLYGRTRFLLLYVLCGMGAALCSLLFHFPVPSVGASGAILGIYGCLFAFMRHSDTALSEDARKAKTGSLVALFVYLLVDGIRDGTIDNAAHVGGALIGFVIGSCFRPVYRTLAPENREVTDRVIS